MSPGGHASSLDRLAAELGRPVALLGVTGWSSERLRALLDRAELRAWQIEAGDLPGSVAAPGLLAGRDPIGSGRATLGLAKPPIGEAVPGAFVVGRAIPVGPGRWILLGRARIVAPGEHGGRFERLLTSLRAPRGEFWRVHGGVLAQAARAA